MNFYEYANSFREHDPSLVDAIIAGYRSIFESIDQPILAYHGTNDKFTAFDPNKTQDSLFWFSTDKDSIISGKSGAAGSKYLMTCLLLITNPAGWNEYERLTTDQLIASGYDSVKLDDDYIVFDPNNIKIMNVERIS